MKVGNRFFLLGTFLAFAVGLFLVDPAFLEAVARKAARSHLPREIRMAVDLGILPPGKARREILDAPINRRDFGLVLKGFLKLLGAPAGRSAAVLEEGGVFTIAPAAKALSRKTAVEAACRALIHLDDVGLASLSADETASFPDYAPPAKYRPAMAWLRGRSVVRGYPDGTLHAAKAISIRETIYLLYRLYEQVSAQTNMAREDGMVRFVDLPLDHPIVAKLTRLKELGAFDRIRLGETFDGDDQIRLAEIQDMILGILVKAGKPTEPAPMGKIRESRAASSFALRRHLAILAADLADRTSDPQAGAETTFYTDVPARDPVFAALSTLEGRGIRLGYSNGRFRGHERITWFEAVGVLHALLERVSPAEARSAGEEVARRTDFEEFAALIKAKKERIRGILDRRPRYRRS